MLGVVKVSEANAASQQTLFIVSSSPSNTMLGKVTKIICLELKVLWGWCCFAANSIYCLRLPIYPKLEGGDLNAMLGVKTSQGFDAASQQTLFIVFGSQI